MRSEKIPQKLPAHIAFIMDGNGRWAKKRLLPRKAGHREGVKTMRKIVDACFSLSIPYVTVYALSTENRGRPQEELDALFDLMEEYFSEFFDEMMKKGIRLATIGDLSYFPERLRTMITDAVEKSADGTAGTFTIALNYGSHDEILRAVNAAIANGKPLEEGEFSSLLDTACLPDPDLIGRTGGESRLSNFMLYQAAYSELYFIDTLWPDMDTKQLYAILNDFAKRERKYGKLKS